MKILLIVLLFMISYYFFKPKRRFRENKDGVTLISVDYEEWKPETYNGVVVEFYKDSKTKKLDRFKSGSFEKDLEKARKKYPDASHLSSVGHFGLDSRRE